jgi:oligopeptide transport system substrate-binding protein
MTAADVKYSLDRVTNPKTQSPGAGFFGSIKGYDDVAAGKADALSGVTVVDPYTVKIELSRPDATFLHVMAINFSMSCRRKRSRNTVPTSASIRSAPAPSSSPNGRSASASSSSATRTIGVKGLPHIDKITFEVGQEPIVALAAPAEGGDRPATRWHPAGKVPGSDGRTPRFQKARSSRAAVAHRLHHAEHDDGAVRQRQGAPGVNMAINKDRASSGSSTAAPCRPTSRCRR